MTALTKQQQRAVEGAAKLNALGIWAEADNIRVVTSVGSLYAPDRKGRPWSSWYLGYNVPRVEHLDIVEAFRRALTSMVAETSTAVNARREEAAALLERAATLARTVDHYNQLLSKLNDTNKETT